MAMPYDLTLRDGRRHELYGPWCVDPYGVPIDPSAVVSVADRASGAVVPVAA